MSKARIYLRLFREGGLIAVQALVNNPLRSLLSLLGVTIGIFLIIAVFTLVDGLERSIRSSFEILGDEAIFIERMPWGPEEGDEGYAWWKYAQRPDVSLTEAEKLGRRMTSEGALAYFGSTSREVEYGNSSADNAAVVAVTPSYENFISVRIEKGRNFSQTEFSTGSRRCLIGAGVADLLFGEADPIGRTIRIDGYKATVIGVLEKQGESLVGGQTDGWVLIPVRFGQVLMDFRNAKNQIAIKPREGVNFAAFENEVLMNMRSIRKLRPKEEKNFALNKSSMLNQGLDQVFGFMNIAGLIIGGFSILVGGFSIANIMFVSVKERTNIIGIQKALGARRSFILTQFLIESISLCVMGGIVGMAIIYLATLVVTALTSFTLVLTLENIITGLLFSAGIGLISGIVPALQASRMEPIEAIRTGV
jgi:putative ABC transport system permease protein